MISFAQIALWFAGSRTGQIVISGIGLAAAIGIAILKVFNAGKSAERIRADRQSLNNLRSRADVDNEISALPPADVEHRLGRWVRPD